MTALELLDQAARALGWIDYPEDSSEQGNYWHTDLARAPFGPTFPKYSWNPDTDDGDCARMEAALGINVEWYSDSVVVSKRERHRSPRVRAASYASHGGDRNAARRDASLQLAAAIGKARPGEDSLTTLDGETYIYRTGDTC